jgi:allantoinase
MSGSVAHEPWLVVRSRRVLLPDGLAPRSIQVRAGRIAAIGALDDRAPGARELDAGDLVVMPGLVDTHVHMNDPGRAEWEGVECATRAAAAGGVTTLVDMPLNSIPPTTTRDAFDAKLQAVAGRCHVDVGFWGGVVPGNVAEIAPLAARGALGFKAFLTPSGVPEFEHVTEGDLCAALPAIAACGLPLLAHAELPSLLKAPGADADPRDYMTWHDSRPPESEHAAIALLIALAAEHACRIHIVHVASAGALPILCAARESGVPISAETCPHYLTFAAEDIARGATPFKCAPPIRARSHREGLWEGLLSGTIDLIASDHSPAPASLKHVTDGDFLQAWGGIASLQLGLAAVWTGALARRVPIHRLARWMCAAPAALAGLDAIKGAIAVGRDADLVIWDPDTDFVVDPQALQHRHPVTPYAGLRLTGRVHATLLRGELVFEDGRLADEPRGRLVRGGRDQ